MQHTTIGASANHTSEVTNTPSAEATAAVMLDVVPLVMRTIRAYMRQARAADLSVPQFRALAFLKRHPGTSLSEVAGYVGLTLPAASRMIDGLVAREYAQRQLSATNRRCIELRLSAKGAEMLEMTMRSTQDALANLLTPLSAEQRATLIQALETLAPFFSSLAESSDVALSAGSTKDEEPGLATDDGELETVAQ